MGALSVISAGTGSRLPGQRSGRGWEAGSPRWLCLSPVLAAAGVGAATAGVGKTAPKAPRSQVCVGGLCCSLGLLGWSAWSGHLTQSFFTHLRAGAGAAELRRVWPRHPAGRALLLLSGKVFFAVEVLSGKPSVAKRASNGSCAQLKLFFSREQKFWVFFYTQSCFDSLSV